MILFLTTGLRKNSRLLEIMMKKLRNYGIWWDSQRRIVALSAPMQTLVEGLTAVHDITRPLTKAIRDGHSTADLAEMQRAWPPVEHPVVMTHPETKRKALYVNRNSTVYLKEVSERESELLLPFLCDHVRSPDYQCRFRWRKNSIAFWDNRCLQHFAVPDYTERRVMQRVTIK